ncbi:MULTISPECIES: PH domain-containing protein [unclassified Brachybacterium]|uniref:PH domain-containing protein n=1 Tax=unclassified Brachybacterium TaxID=2623841 RepID=UPI000C80893B|nr:MULTISPECIES: PH domain-containing protein [unclassified Brachybacterium]PMC75643.1 hypothetical protein CJ197_07870 [Brachybacterium sp. UMB0905]
MTIPRQIGPEPTSGSVLPDYSRSTATVERMVDALDARRRGGPSSRGQVRALLPRNPTMDTLLRSVIAAVLLGIALIPVIIMVLLLVGLDDGRAPGLAMILVLLAMGAMAVLLLLLGLRFAWVALCTARSRVEITDAGLRVVGAVGSTEVPWRDIEGIESKVVHPVHWLTAAVRRKDGRRVIMSAFDRHVWTWSEPTGQDIRLLRTVLHEHTSGGRRRP